MSPGAHGAASRLVQDFMVRFRDDETGTGWERQPQHGTPLPIDSAEEACALLGELPTLISAATASVARSSPDFMSLPIIRLESSALMSEPSSARSTMPATGCLLSTAIWESSSSTTVAGAIALLSYRLHASNCRNNWMNGGSLQKDHVRDRELRIREEWELYRSTGGPR
jgi:hypothetical protein